MTKPNETPAAQTCDCRDCRERAAVGNYLCAACDTAGCSASGTEPCGNAIAGSPAALPDVAVFYACRRCGGTTAYVRMPGNVPYCQSCGDAARIVGPFPTAEAARQDAKDAKEKS